MEGFTYHNIFETKGLEYLAIVIFFLILIPFWIMLNKKGTLAKQVQKSLGALTPDSLRIPQGLFYSRFHTWAHMERSGVAKVGLDDLLMHITGEVKINRLKASGERIVKGDLLAEIDHKGKLLKVFSPISGEIMEANAVLADSPGLINEDPYVKGWMYKIRPSSWVADTNSYFLAEDATLWATQELDRFKDFLSASLGKYSPQPSQLILQDGGELRDQPLSDLPVEVWQDFQQDFLDKKTLRRNENCFLNKKED
jgi:glycine cleavage system H protein